MRISNDQLAVPSRIIDPTSDAVVINGTTTPAGQSVLPDLAINAIQSVNANDIVQLGRQFLSAVLTLNQDAGQFALWQAATPATPNAGEAGPVPSLVAADESDKELAGTFCAAGEPPTAPPAGGGDLIVPGVESPGASSAAGSGLSAPGAATTTATGAILAAVVPTLVVLSCAGIALWWFCSRRRRRRHGGSGGGSGDAHGGDAKELDDLVVPSASAAREQGLGLRLEIGPSKTPKAEIAGDSVEGSWLWRKSVTMAERGRLAFAERVSHPAELGSDGREQRRYFELQG